MDSRHTHLSVCCVLTATITIASLLISVSALAPVVSAWSQRAQESHQPMHRAETVRGEPKICSGCVPPLTYFGGPVMSTNAAGGVFVTPIYWQPAGGKYAFPRNYEELINRYVRDIARASGHETNVYSNATEYYQKSNGAKTFITYKISAGKPIVDTDSLPSNGCKPSSGFAACITDDQLRAELRHLTRTLHLKTDLAHFYPVFFPANVETKDRDGSTSANAFCGYHRAFGSGATQTVYGNEPLDTAGCTSGQSPNGNEAADTSIDTLSHELTEAITDPESPNHAAWNDQTGNEIGDMCASTYGLPLGSTSKSKPGSTEYNQVINGDKYYTQTEFSNLAYSKYGLGKGCSLSEALAQNPKASEAAAAGATTVASIFSFASPLNLPADGKSKSEIRVVVEDPQAYGVPADPVHFSASVQSGSGHCGSFSTANKPTNSGGVVTVNYTASSDNVACSIVAIDAKGGRSAESVIYQGTATKQSPTIHASFPTSIVAGGGTTTFTEKVDNRSPHALPAARLSFYIWPASSHSKRIKADQVHVTYSTTGPHGKFTVLPLTGTTGGGAAIEGYVGPQQGSTLAAGATDTITYHVTTTSSVPVSTHAPLVSFESYLDQVNSASGTGATLADSFATDATVHAAPQSHSLLIAAIVTGIVALLAAATLFIWTRLRKSTPKAPLVGT